MYSISNYGRVYTHYFNRLLVIDLNHGGYPHVQLKLKNGKYLNTSIHRLLMLIYRYVDNNNELYVNHINGCKTDFDFDNLEWVTPSENVRHALETGLIQKINEDHPNAIITNEQAHYICKRLEDGLISTDILRELGLENNLANLSVISNIRQGYTWKNISKDYNIKPIRIRANQLFTNNEVHEICQMMEDGLTDDQIIINKNLDKSKCKRTLYNIRSGRKMVAISKNYNIPFNGKKPK